MQLKYPNALKMVAKTLIDIIARYKSQECSCTSGTWNLILTVFREAVKENYLACLSLAS
jgi:hypothetical protein